jgi:hypothetical protein
MTRAWEPEAWLVREATMTGNREWVSNSGGAD